MSGKEDVIGDDGYNGHEHDGIISRAVAYLFHQVSCVWQLHAVSQLRTVPCM